MSRKESRLACIRRIAATGAAAVLGAALAYVPAWAGGQLSVLVRADVQMRVPTQTVRHLCAPAPADVCLYSSARQAEPRVGMRPGPARALSDAGGGEYLPEEAWEEADLLPPEVRIEMEGQPYSASDPEYYYRADNCGIRVFFSDHGEDLGQVRDGETGIYRVTIDGGLE